MSHFSFENEFWVTQGILFSTPETIKTPMDALRLWLHEASRVYADKLIEDKDMDTFQKIKFEIAKIGFEARIKNLLAIANSA